MPPKRLPPRAEGCAAVVLAAGVALAVVVVGFAWPKRELVPVACGAAPPNKPEPAGFEAAEGGAPAGVVEGIDIVGLAGVKDALPKRPEGGASEEPVAPAAEPKRDEAGAADEAGGVADAPPKRPPAG